MSLKKIAILDSSYPINSRNLRILEYLKMFNDVEVITWDRKSDYSTIQANYKVFLKKSLYGNKVEKLKNMPSYYKFVRDSIKDYSPDVVIASNWDMLMISSLIKLNTKFKLIYENRDMVSSKYYIVKKSLSFIEKLALLNTNSMILASRFFHEHYDFYKKEKIVIENKVPKDMMKYKKVKSEKLRISFIGSVRFYEILINLIEAGKELSSVEINIYGEGPDRIKIEKYLEDKNITNVKVYGSFSYKDIGKIYSKTDIVWSVYPNAENSNKKYVIPNKYFESIYFETPGIFPIKTKAGYLVEKQEIGYIVDPYSRKDIRNLINYILKNNEFKSKVNNIKKNIDNISWNEEIKLLDKIL